MYVKIWFFILNTGLVDAYNEDFLGVTYLLT